MRRKRGVAGLFSAALLAGALLGIGSASATSETAPEPPGSIEFVAKNAVATANGVFHQWRVTRSHIDFSDLLRSFVEIEIDVASLDTAIERRDDHLRGEDFFEIERWPTATARIHRVTVAAEDEGADANADARYDALFELRIRDVTKTVPGSFALVRKMPPTVEGQLILDRTDWGVGKPKQRFNPISISNEVVVRFRATLPTSP